MPPRGRLPNVGTWPRGACFKNDRIRDARGRHPHRGEPAALEVAAPPAAVTATADAGGLYSLRPSAPTSPPGARLAWRLSHQWSAGAQMAAAIKAPMRWSVQGSPWWSTHRSASQRTGVAAAVNATNSNATRILPGRSRLMARPCGRRTDRQHARSAVLSLATPRGGDASVVERVGAGGVTPALPNVEGRGTSLGPNRRLDGEAQHPDDQHHGQAVVDQPHRNERHAGSVPRPTPGRRSRRR